MVSIKKTVNKLTLDEKISLLTGFNSWYSNKIPRLKIPSMKTVSYTHLRAHET